MDKDNFKIVMAPEELSPENEEAYGRACMYLLEKYCEVCIEYEGFGVFESFYRRTSPKRVLDTSTEV